MTLFWYQIFLLFIILFNGTEGKGELKTLDETSWSDMLEGEWMVEL